MCQFGKIFLTYDKFNALNGSMNSKRSRLNLVKKEKWAKIINQQSRALKNGGSQIFNSIRLSFIPPNHNPAIWSDQIDNWAIRRMKTLIQWINDDPILGPKTKLLSENPQGLLK